MQTTCVRCGFRLDADWHYRACIPKTYWPEDKKERHRIAMSGGVGVPPSEFMLGGEPYTYDPTYKRWNRLLPVSVAPTQLRPTVEMPPEPLQDALEALDPDEVDYLASSGIPVALAPTESHEIEGSDCECGYSVTEGKDYTMALRTHHRMSKAHKAVPVG